MSTKIGTEFGSIYADNYEKVISKWAKKLDGVSEISDTLRSEWGADLQKSLGEDVIDALMEHTASQWKKSGKNLPSKDVMVMYAQIAAKGALAADTGDLLQRLQISANTAPTEAITAAIQPGELVKRAHQTVAQIFDMAQDRFNRSVSKFVSKVRGKPLTRRWATHNPNSRHAALDGQTKTEDQMFEYGGEEIYGPRPPGGSPANWSNCSCTLEYLR